MKNIVYAENNAQNESRPPYWRPAFKVFVDKINLILFPKRF